MSKYYVHMLDGQVDSKPMEISGSPDDSPNTEWALDQMKKNDMLPCKITYDPSTEEPDYANPKIYEDYVEYIGKPLSDEVKRQLFNTQAQKNREAELPPLKDVVNAILQYNLTGDRTFIETIQKQIQAVNDKYPLE